MSGTHDNELLISRHLAGSASPRELEALGARLEAEPDLARTLYARAAMERDLRVLFKAARPATRGSRLRIKPSRRSIAGTSPGSVAIRPRRRWWVTAAAAAAVIAFGILFRAKQSPQQPDTLAVLEQARGKVYLDREGAEREVRSGHRIAAHDTLRTDSPDSEAQVVYLSGSRLTLRGKTTLALAPRAATDDTAYDVHLATGSLDAEIAHAQAGRFAFSTPHARVLVTGTSLMLDVEPLRTRVDVDTGHVRVTCNASGRTVVLAGGGYAVVDKASFADVRPAARTAPAPDGPVALYTFQEKRGPVVHDVSGFGKPLDLRVETLDGIVRLPGGGLRLAKDTVIRSIRPATKIVDACRAGREVSVELWVRPQPYASKARRTHRRIMALSSPRSSRSDLFVMVLRTDPSPTYAYYARARAELEPRDEEVRLLSRSEVRPERTHIVLTRSAAGRSALYVNGNCEALQDSAVRSGFSEWPADSYLYVANGPLGNSCSLGDYLSLAVYCRALSDEEIAARYRAGPPQDKGGKLRQAVGPE